MRKPEELVQTKVRMPEQLRRSIEKRAKKSGRSFSAEAVALLEKGMRAGSVEEKLKEGFDVLQESLERLNAGIKRSKLALSGAPTGEAPPRPSLFAVVSTHLERATPEEIEQASRLLQYLAGLPAEEKARLARWEEIEARYREHLASFSPEEKARLARREEELVALKGPQAGSAALLAAPQDRPIRATPEQVFEALRDYFKRAPPKDVDEFGKLLGRGLLGEPRAKAPAETESS